MLLAVAVALPAHATMPRPLELCCLEAARGLLPESNPNCPKPPPDRAQCERIVAGWYAYADQVARGQPPDNRPPEPVKPATPPGPGKETQRPAAKDPSPSPAFSWSDEIHRHPQGAGLLFLPLLLTLGLIAVCWRSLGGIAKAAMLGLAVLLPAQFYIAWLEVQALPKGVTSGARDGLAMIFFWLLHAIWLGLLGMGLLAALWLVRGPKGPARWFGILALAGCLASGLQAWQIIPPRI